MEENEKPLEPEEIEKQKKIVEDLYKRKKEETEALRKMLYKLNSKSVKSKKTEK